jgi:hypothetical protein
VETERGIASAPEEGFYKPVGHSFSMDEARNLAISLLTHKAQEEGASMEQMETEVIEEAQFNMVRGFYTTGKNIRVKVQIKPGLIEDYKVDSSTMLDLEAASDTKLSINPYGQQESRGDRNDQGDL